MIHHSLVPTDRILVAGQRPVLPDGEYVLYWMNCQRRTRYNFALERAIEWAVELGLPVVVLDALSVSYPQASDRHHLFAIEGMRENGRRLTAAGIGYYPFIEREQGQGRGLVAAIGRRAAVVVADDNAHRHVSEQLVLVGGELPCRLELIDGSGVVPVSLAGKYHASCHSFRRMVHRQGVDHVLNMPSENPIASVGLPAPPRLPQSILRRWPRATAEELETPRTLLARIPIDHSVGPAATRGGTSQAMASLERFVGDHLSEYCQGRRRPDADGTSGLSPYLHFGHIASHDILAAVFRAHDWHPGRINPGAVGKRSGFWGLGAGGDEFVDQLVSWRELAFNAARYLPGFQRYSSLPEWARATLAGHQSDEREHLYTLEQLDGAETHDRLWNAAQRQLVAEGRMHNFLRMLWGKNVVRWTPGPEQAFATLLSLNDRYAVDGRDPNSVAGVAWVFGRYDRPWPRQPIFGTVRSMSSASTARKLPVEGYMARYCPRSESSVSGAGRRVHPAETLEATGG